MLRFISRDIKTMDSTSDINRLETPFMAGFRSGMSSCSVIGRKLGALYIIPSDRPARIEALIKAIERDPNRPR